MNGNSKVFMWIISGLVMIALAFSGYSMSRTDTITAAQASIHEKYVSKQDFRDFVEKVDKKLDKISDQLFDLQKGDKK